LKTGERVHAAAFEGRPFRLTDVSGNVVPALLA